MTKRNYRWTFMIAVLALAALACAIPGLGGGGDDPAAVQEPSQSEEGGEDTGTTDTQSNDDAPVVSDSGEDADPVGSDDPIVEDSGSDAGDTDTGSEDTTTSTGDGPASVDLDDETLYDEPTNVNTYHVSLLNTFDAVDASGSPITGQVDMLGQQRLDPYETTLEFNTDGDAVLGGGEVFTFTQILDQQYIVSPTLPECFSGSPGLQENPFEVLLDAGGLLTGQAQRLPDQVINDIDSYVYEITNDNMDPLDGAGADVEEITNGWIAFAKDGMYVVQLHIEGRGVNDLLSQNGTIVGDIFYELNYFGFDTPVNIMVPFGCGGDATTDTDYPIPDDAFNLAAFGGAVTFTTLMSLEDTVDFYKTEMPLVGCTLSQELPAPGVSNLTYTCPTETVIVAIVDDPAGTGRLVTIASLP